MAHYNMTKERFKATEPAKLPVGTHHDGGGLYLQVVRQPGSGNVTRAWLFRYQIAGKSLAFGLGPLDVVGLARARAKAQDARIQLSDGIDPAAAKRAQRVAQRVETAKGAALTFADATAAYIAAQGAGWSTKHVQQWERSLAAYAFPIFGKLPVAAVDTALVLKAVEPDWQAKTVTMDRVRNRIESVLDWAKVKGHREGDNPARWAGHLEMALDKTAKAAAGQGKHHDALPYAELPDFMAELRRVGGTAARALAFTILTAARTEEAIGATWSEVDLAARMWTIPGERMKAGGLHRVPLSDAAIACLGPARNPSDRLFSGDSHDGGLSEKAMKRTAQRIRKGITVHGFRSTFADWAAEQGYAENVFNSALAHKIADKVLAAYNRTDFAKQRVALMAAWGRWCDGIEAKGAEVVSLVRRA